MSTKNKIKKEESLEYIQGPIVYIQCRETEGVTLFL